MALLALIGPLTPKKKWRREFWKYFQNLKLASFSDVTSFMAQKWPFLRKIGHLRYFDPIDVGFSTNFIVYPIKNVDRSIMEAFSKSKNGALVLHDVIMGSKITIFRHFFRKNR